MAEPPRGERIAKWLARAGVASRRDAEKLLAEGRIRLNNAPVSHPATFVSAGDLVVVEWRGGGRAGAHPAVALSQAGRTGHHASRSAGPAHSIRQAAIRPAARDQRRSA